MDSKSEYTREKLLQVAEQASSAAKPRLVEMLTEAADHIARLEAKLAVSTLRDDFAKAAMPFALAQEGYYPSAARITFEIADEMLDARLGTRAVDARVAELEKQVAALEELRPHWAKGYTSDSMAAQGATGALQSLWKMLGAKDQTQAALKLNALLAAK